MAEDKQGGAAAKVKAVAEEVVAEIENVVSEVEQRAIDLVHKWRADHLTNNAFSQDTGAWNVLHEKLPHLIRAIVEEIG